VTKKIKETDVIFCQVLTATTAVVAFAAAIHDAALPVFDFDGVHLTNGTGNNAAVQTYLDSTVGTGIVTVYGAVAQQTYNGDGHASTDPSGPNRGRWLLAPRMTPPVLRTTTTGLPLSHSA
jgi:hypothetical protein